MSKGHPSVDNGCPAVFLPSEGKMLSIKNRCVENWEKIRAKGKVRFVFFYGAIGWGVSTASISIVIMWLLAPSVNLKDFTFLSFVIFPLLGILWAVNIWRRCEGEVKKIC